MQQWHAVEPMLLWAGCHLPVIAADWCLCVHVHVHTLSTSLFGTRCFELAVFS
jgi:hypothetical protein